MYPKLVGGGEEGAINGDSSPGAKSEILIRWLFASPNILTPDSSPELAIETGSIKRKYALALTDSYVIAAAKLSGCRAIFRSPEEEMSRGNKLARINKEERVEVVFLRDYS